LGKSICSSSSLLFLILMFPFFFLPPTGSSIQVLFCFLPPSVRLGRRPGALLPRASGSPAWVACGAADGAARGQLRQADGAGAQQGWREPSGRAQERQRLGRRWVVRGRRRRAMGGSVRGQRSARASGASGAQACAAGAGTGSGGPEADVAQVDRVAAAGSGCKGQRAAAPECARRGAARGRGASRSNWR
jgi:hypothetical protein